MKSIIFRNSQLFLRNEFEKEGEWGISVIKKQKINLEEVELISCTDTSRNDQNNLHKGIHHFVDDYRIDNLYIHPNNSIEKYSRYKFVLTPDYSLYSEMPLWRQIESVGKSRWVGAYWQSIGMTVIPTISWGQALSYNFCFAGVEKHSLVAIGMIGCKKCKLSFLRGYNKMMEIIEPEGIICFGEPFREMEGNIKTIDYISSRRVMRNGR